MDKARKAWINERRKAFRQAMSQTDTFLLLRAGLETKNKLAALKKKLEISDENRCEAWEAMAMIREAIETLGPVGAVKAGEYVLPGFINEAEALIEGIKKMEQN